MPLRTRIWLDRRQRRLRNDDPAPPPQGWEVAPPDFVGVGAQKAGTTWWYEQLVAHPRVVRPPGARKELRFFNPYGQRPFGLDDAARYHRLFPRPPATITGEWTPSYMADFWVPELLARAAPEALLLVLLRDPVDRFVSGLTQSKARGRRIGLAHRRASFATGLYASQLERLWSWFPREQTLVLQYEQCTTDARRYLRATYEFLGLDPTYHPPDLERPVHATVLPKPTLDREAEAALATAYLPEIQRLAQLCPTIDVDLWKRG